MIVFIVPQDEQHRSLFTQIYSNHIAGIVRFARSMVGDEAEDAAHEAFIRIAKNIHKLVGRSDSEIKHYLITTVKRVCWTMLKEPETDELIDIIATDEVTDIVDANATKERLVRLVSELPERDRQLLGLRYHNGMSYEELSVQTGLSIKNVSVRLHRIRKHLRQQCEVAT